MTRDIEGNAAAPSGGAITTSAIWAKGPEAKALHPLAALAIDPRTKRVAFLTALIAIAALAGAMAGALAAWGLMRPAARAVDAAPIGTSDETRVLQGAITVLRSDLAELKTSVEADARSTNAQFARLGERFDRIDRPQGARETTGSVSRCRSSSKDGSCVTPVAARPPSRTVSQRQDFTASPQTRPR